MTSPSGRIDTDMSRWPIVVFRTVGSPSDEQVDAFVTQSQELLDRGERYVVVFDNLLADLPSAYMRRTSGEWLQKNGARMDGVCLGTALLFRSPAMRFVMSGVMLVASHPTPHAVCATLDDALRWARAQLAR